MDSHPQRNSIDDSFLREIRIGLGVVALLLLVFGWVAWLKYSGRLAIGPQNSAVAADAGQHAAKDQSSPSPSALLNSSVQSNRLRDSQSPGVEVAERPGSTPLQPGASGGASVEESSSDARRNREPGGLHASALSPPARDSQAGSLFSGGSFRPLAASPVRPPTLPSSGPTDSVAREPVSRTSFMSDLAESAAPDSREIPVMPPLRSESKKDEPAEAEDVEGPSDNPEGPSKSGNLVRSMVHPRAISGSGDLESHRVSGPGQQSTRGATSIVVQQGDSFWQIAQRIYGDGRYYQALHAANQKQFPSIDLVTPGSRLAIPEIEELQKAFPDLCPNPESDLADPDSRAVHYVTKEGDTLFGIARDQLGQASRYNEIWRLNQGRLPEGTSHESILESGMELVLPAPIR